MAFSQTGITDVRVMADGADLFVAWSATDPPGTTFQVYIDRRLAWYGAARRCHAPIPAGGPGRNIWVEVGAVDAGGPTRDHSPDLVAPGGRTERARLSWSGGTYLDPTGRDDVGGFRIHRGREPGGPADLSAPVGEVAAYPGGWINDGFGKGDYGGGGFGRAATAYRWESGPLPSGTWRFAVLPFDKAGNALGAPRAADVAIVAAPRPPAPGPGGSRLASDYAGPSTRRLTLHWLPSPSDPR